MTSSSSIRVGIAGLGWPGERHAEAIDGSTLGIGYCACDLNAERLNALAAIFEPKHTFTSFDEMLMDQDVDAIVISLPNSLHYACSLKALEAGEHVCCRRA